MKKVISILIMITLVVFSVNLSYANDSDVVASLSNSTVKIGDTVTLSINIAQTEDGIAGLQGKITWDDSQLTYVSSKVGSDFTTLNFNDDTTSDALGTFSVYGNEYITTGGTAFTVTFKVNSGLNEETPIHIDITGIKAEYQTAGTVDIQNKEESLSIIDGATNNEDNSEKNENLTNGTQTNQMPVNTNTNSSVATNVSADNTTAKVQLPKAGVSGAIIFAIVIIVILLIVSGKNYMQYLKDTKKQLK